MKQARPAFSASSATVLGQPYRGEFGGCSLLDRGVGRVSASSASCIFVPPYTRSLIPIYIGSNKALACTACTGCLPLHHSVQHGQEREGIAEAFQQSQRPDKTYVRACPPTETPSLDSLSHLQHTGLS